MRKKKQKQKKIRPLGAVMLDLEPLIEELIYEHDLQWSDVLGLVYAYLMAHCPSARETYIDDGSHPQYYYGPK